MTDNGACPDCGRPMEVEKLIVCPECTVPLKPGEPTYGVLEQRLKELECQVSALKDEVKMWEDDQTILIQVEAAKVRLKESELQVEALKRDSAILVGVIMTSSNLSRIIKGAEAFAEKHPPSKESLMEGKRCPCEFNEIEPCDSNCTCRCLIMSGGCSRCATYGSADQQLAVARMIVGRDLQVDVIKPLVTVAVEFGECMEDKKGRGSNAALVVLLNHIRKYREKLTPNDTRQMTAGEMAKGPKGPVPQSVKDACTRAVSDMHPQGVEPNEVCQLEHGCLIYYDTGKLKHRKCDGIVEDVPNNMTFRVAAPGELSITSDSRFHLCMVCLHEGHHGGKCKVCECA